MSSISKEEMADLDEISKRIGAAQLNLENAKLVLDLEKLKFENYKLNLFLKYKLSKDMFINANGEIKNIEKANVPGSSK